jgi:hypothetical protein
LYIKYNHHHSRNNAPHLFHVCSYVGNPSFFLRTCPPFRIHCDWGAAATALAVLTKDVESTPDARESLRPPRRGRVAKKRAPCGPGDSPGKDKLLLRARGALLRPAAVRQRLWLKKVGTAALPLPATMRSRAPFMAGPCSPSVRGKAAKSTRGVDGWFRLGCLYSFRILASAKLFLAVRLQPVQVHIAT